jgi:esterase
MSTSVEPREHTLEARGLSFHYVEWGEPSSPAMVLLHGLSSHCRLWDTFAGSMQARYHVLGVDQRGHGDTSWPSTPHYATDDFVGDLEALTDLWGLSQFVLIGLSMGGHNAIAYAARHRERVSHLIPVDIAPWFDREKADPTVRQMWERLAVEGHPEFDDPDFAFAQMRSTNLTTPDEALRHRAAYAVKRLADGKYTFKHDPKVGLNWRPADLWPVAPDIQTPTLIVRGGKSMVLSEKVGERMASSFPNARLVTVEQSGHTVPEDCPAEFEAAVRHFLGL